MSSKEIKEKIVPTDDLRYANLSGLIAVLSKTVYSFQKVESNGMQLTVICSVVFDFCRNFAIYALPFELMKHIQDPEQYKHDCYLLTKNTIDKCDISPPQRDNLSAILQEEFYSFSAKTYNNLHLEPYKSLMENSLSFSKSEIDEPETILYKTLVYPLLVFVLEKFPMDETLPLTLQEKQISEYLSFATVFISQICIYDNIISNKKLTPAEACNSLLSWLFTRLKIEFESEIYEYCYKVVSSGFKILLDNTPNSKKLGLDKTRNILESFDPSHKESKKSGVKPNGKRTSTRKKSTNSTVPKSRKSKQPARRTRKKV